MAVDQAFIDALSEKPIDRALTVANFKCNPEIDWFLTNVACDFHERRITSVTCWLHEGDLAGYVSTSMSLVKIENSPQREQLGLRGVTFREGAKEYKQFPALLIGMLGVCDSYRKRGLGLHMLQVTIGRARAISRDVGCRFVVVDSDKTPEALGLYRRAEFKQVEGQDRENTVLMYFDLGRLN